MTLNEKITIAREMKAIADLESLRSATMMIETHVTGCRKKMSTDKEKFFQNWRALRTKEKELGKIVEKYHAKKFGRKPGTFFCTSCHKWKPYDFTKGDQLRPSDLCLMCSIMCNAAIPRRRPEFPLPDPLPEVPKDCELTSERWRRYQPVKEKPLPESLDSDSESDSDPETFRCLCGCGKVFDH